MEYNSEWEYKLKLKHFIPFYGQYKYMTEIRLYDRN